MTMNEFRRFEFKQLRPVKRALTKPSCQVVVAGGGPGKKNPTCFFSWLLM